MPKFVLFVLLGTFLLGFVFAMVSFKAHLSAGGLPLVSSLRDHPLLFKRFIAGMVVAVASIALLLALGPWKF